MKTLLSAIDRVSVSLGYLAMVVFVLLVADMMYEVVSRRLFSAPTLWAYDIAYMSNGVGFLLAAGYTLLANEHIRIDFLSTRMPRRVQDGVNAAVYLFLIFPMFAFVCHGAITEGWSAFVTGELEPSSPWKPVIWPFYAGIALGSCVFFLQAIAQFVRHVTAALGAGPSPLERHHDEASHV